MKTIIRNMVENDIPAVARVHSLAFARQRHSDKWIECNFRAHPRIQYYVAIQDTEIVGYIEWIIKSGFRPEAVLELEQIAVLPSKQGKGIGRLLIDGSLPKVRNLLEEYDSVLKHVLVSTRIDNYAQRLYKNSLGASPECVIKDLYSDDEVIMVARNIDKK